MKHSFRGAVGSRSTKRSLDSSERDWFVERAIRAVKPCGCREPAPMSTEHADSVSGRIAQRLMDARIPR